MSNARTGKRPLPTGSKEPAGGVKVALAPQRSNGRERVILILEAAAEAIYENGFEAATMKQIAERSGTRIGSLYRFFPTKEILGDALIQKFAEFSEAQWQEIVLKAATVTTDQLTDILLDAYIKSREHNKALPTLLESGSNWSNKRLEFRARNLERITDALKAHAPHLKRSAAKRIGVIMLYNMRTMNALTFEAAALNAPGPSTNCGSVPEPTWEVASAFSRMADQFLDWPR